MMQNSSTPKKWESFQHQPHFQDLTTRKMGALMELLPQGSHPEQCPAAFCSNAIESCWAGNSTGMFFFKIERRKRIGSLTFDGGVFGCEVLQGEPGGCWKLASHTHIIYIYIHFWFPIAFKLPEFKNANESPKKQTLRMEPNFSSLGHV